MTMHLAFNTVQRLQCKTLNFLSRELWPHDSPELIFTDYTISGVIQQHELLWVASNKTK